MERDGEGWVEEGWDEEGWDEEGWDEDGEGWRGMERDGEGWDAERRDGEDRMGRQGRELSQTACSHQISERRLVRSGLIVTAPLSVGLVRGVGLVCVGLVCVGLVCGMAGVR